MLLLTAALTAVISNNELDFDVPFADAQQLHVYSSPDGFMIFSTGSKGSSGAGMGIVPGDRLVGKPLSTASLYTALQAKTNTTTVLPLVEEIEGVRTKSPSLAMLACLAPAGSDSLHRCTFYICRSVTLCSFYIVRQL
jgi:hypothetical protein